MPTAVDSDPGGSRLSKRMRLVPLQAAADRPPGAGPGTAASIRPADHRRIAHRLVVVLCQVFDGHRPLSGLRTITSPEAYYQFSRVYHRLTTTEIPPRLRVSRSVADGADRLEIVVSVEIGASVRALALRAHRVGGSQWRLTLCHLIGGY